jgi:hypothetical protein
MILIDPLLHSRALMKTQRNHYTHTKVIERNKLFIREVSALRRQFNATDYFSVFMGSSRGTSKW